MDSCDSLKSLLESSQQSVLYNGLISGQLYEDLEKAYQESGRTITPNTELLEKFAIEDNAATSNNEAGSSKSGGDNEQECTQKRKPIDVEALAQYLMKQCSVAPDNEAEEKRHQREERLQPVLDVFKKYGLDIKKIAKNNLNCKFPQMVLDIDHEITDDEVFEFCTSDLMGLTKMKTAEYFDRRLEYLGKRIQRAFNVPPTPENIKKFAPLYYQLQREKKAKLVEVEFDDETWSNKKEDQLTSMKRVIAAPPGDEYFNEKTLELLEREESDSSDSEDDMEDYIKKDVCGKYRFPNDGEQKFPWVLTNMDRLGEVGRPKVNVEEYFQYDVTPPTSIVDYKRSTYGFVNGYKDFYAYEESSDNELDYDPEKDVDETDKDLLEDAMPTVVQSDNDVGFTAPDIKNPSADQVKKRYAKHPEEAKFKAIFNRVQAGEIQHPMDLVTPEMKEKYPTSNSSKGKKRNSEAGPSGYSPEVVAEYVKNETDFHDMFEDFDKPDSTTDLFEFLENGFKEIPSHLKVVKGNDYPDYSKANWDLSEVVSRPSVSSKNTFDIFQCVPHAHELNKPDELKETKSVVKQKTGQSDQVEKQDKVEEKKTEKIESQVLPSSSTSQPVDKPDESETKTSVKTSKTDENESIDQIVSAMSELSSDEPEKKRGYMDEHPDPFCEFNDHDIDDILFSEDPEEDYGDDIEKVLDDYENYKASKGMGPDPEDVCTCFDADDEMDAVMEGIKEMCTEEVLFPITCEDLIEIEKIHGITSEEPTETEPNVDIDLEREDYEFLIEKMPTLQELLNDGNDEEEVQTDPVRRASVRKNLKKAFENLLWRPTGKTPDFEDKLLKLIDKLYPGLDKIDPTKIPEHDSIVLGDILKPVISEKDIRKKLGLKKMSSIIEGSSETEEEGTSDSTEGSSEDYEELSFTNMTKQQALDILPSYSLFFEKQINLREEGCHFDTGDHEKLPADLKKEMYDFIMSDEPITKKDVKKWSKVISKRNCGVEEFEEKEEKEDEEEESEEEKEEDKEVVKKSIDDLFPEVKKKPEKKLRDVDQIKKEVEENKFKDDLSLSKQVETVSAQPFFTLGVPGIEKNERSHIEALEEKYFNIPKKEPTQEKSRVIKLADRSSVIVENTMWAENMNKMDLSGFSSIPSMAITYPFTLDPFQKQAIMALENDNHVFVSAHTSAGKTVVAEYAIAMAKGHGTRSIYTSPIKALSNQKFYDFRKRFGNVGLITGDYQINETADCLIMTTEILRSMLYNNSDTLGALEVVIFDEVHYINDSERGTVWEEVLILLPAEAKIVMLSATVPNTMEFASWVGRTKQRIVKVCSTKHRPVPLNHYVYCEVGHVLENPLYLVKEGDSNFREFEYQRLLDKIKEEVAKQAVAEQNKMFKKMERAQDKKLQFFDKQKQSPHQKFQSNSARYQILQATGGHQRGSGPNSNQTSTQRWTTFVEFLRQKDWLPAVVFVFSRKACDILANNVKSHGLVTKKEYLFMNNFMDQHIKKLDPMDQELDQVLFMKRLLLRGVGVHHSGILPMLKEFVEVFFQKGYVKVLFATETFSMGVNMPAKTVVFDSLQKFDGFDKRYLKPEEYIQMAGRAGRRGMDEAGNVIMLTNKQAINMVPVGQLASILEGSPYKLISKFRLSYHMILNTLRTRGTISVTDMMAKSYCENSKQASVLKIKKELDDFKDFMKSLDNELQQKHNPQYLDAVKLFNKLAIELYDGVTEQWKDIRLDVKEGSIVKVSQGHYVNRIGVVLKREIIENRNDYKVLILENHRDFLKRVALSYDPAPGEEERWFKIVGAFPEFSNNPGVDIFSREFKLLTVSTFTGISNKKVAMKVHEIRHVCDSLLKKTFKKRDIDEVTDKIISQLIKLSSSDINFTIPDNMVATKIQLESLFEHSTISMKDAQEVFRFQGVESHTEKLESELSESSMALYPDYQAKLELLKQMDYISHDQMIQTKGFMASRIGKHELVVAELLVQNVFSNLTPQEISALLSILVFPPSASSSSSKKPKQPTGPSDEPEEPEIPPNLEEAIELTKRIVSEVQYAESRANITDGQEDVSYDLVPVIFKWASQKTFRETLENTDYQAGRLVRWIQQLLEVLKEVESAVRLVGDAYLTEKMRDAIQIIKRGIVFTPSLYTNTAEEAQGDEDVNNESETFKGDLEEQNTQGDANLED